MRQTLEQVNHQIGENRNARHQLERDLQNKDHAIGIDHSCHQVIMCTIRTFFVRAVIHL